VSDRDGGNGDSPELEELFDSIVHQVSTVPPQAASDCGPIGEVQSADLAQDIHANPAPMYEQVGQVTRKLHDAIHDIGHDEALERIARAIPDARDRLNYISTLTRNAAEHVLDATDVARPIQDSLHDQAAALLARWDQLFGNQLPLDQFRPMAEDTRRFLASVPGQTQETSDQLLKMVMAQDFQDLTGQVIKKMNVIVKDIEQDLVNILVNFSPGGATEESLPFGRNEPAQEPGSEVVADQQQVDDLLDRLGF
jgi:chemotaxis protein CheZ